jgi:hypothetical protein
VCVRAAFKKHNFFISSNLEAYDDKNDTFREKPVDFCQSLGAFSELQKATKSFVMSVCLSIYPSALNSSDPTRRIFMKFDI